MGPRVSAVATRVLGVGLASALAAVTVVLALTDRIGLYINPESAWFAVGMSVLGLVGAVASFALPLGAEADHGHDHGDAPAARTARAPHAYDHDHDHKHGHDRDHDHDHERIDLEAGTPLRLIATATGGVLATGLIGIAMITPPASLSAELAMSRDTGAPPLFQGADSIALATTGDTESFGVGEWASVFATATNPEAFEGDEISLTGFVTPNDGGGFALTRLIITHCVIDAQPASIPVGTAVDAAVDAAPGTGDWVTVTGVIRDRDGRLEVEATAVQAIDEPEDPYEY